MYDYKYHQRPVMGAHFLSMVPSMCLLPNCSLSEEIFFNEIIFREIQFFFFSERLYFNMSLKAQVKSYFLHKKLCNILLNPEIKFHELLKLPRSRNKIPPKFANFSL